MGKIRVKALGDTEAEKKQQQEAKKRKEAKSVEKNAQAPASSAAKDTPSASDIEVKEKPSKSSSSTKQSKYKNKKTRSTAYKQVAGSIDAKRVYSLQEALALLPKLKRAKFDETVELHINTTGQGITLSTVLPHGTGKTTRVAIANEQIIAEVEKGLINFDVLVAEPTMMPRLAKVAKILGPRGLMPNPKNGTVTTKPEEVAQKYANGQVHFKTEAKFPLLHLRIGKISFGEQRLAENVKAISEALPAQQVKSATIKLTMSPAVHLDYTSI